MKRYHELSEEEGAMARNVNRCFAQAEDQGQYMVALYRLAFPDWDEITKIDGWPKAGAALSKYIWDRAIAFDQQYHPEVMAGGAWMNNGFGTDESLQPWGLDASNCRVEYA